MRAGVDVKKWIFVILLFLSPFLFAGQAGAYPLRPDSPVVKNALAYLKSCQLDDGGFGPGGITEWVVIGLAAAGQDPGNWKKNGKSPIDFLSGQKSPGDLYGAIRMTLALTAARGNPRSFQGEDYVGRVLAAFREGQFGDPLSVRDDYWAVIALAGAGKQLRKEVQASVGFILKNQNQDGSWSASVTGIETCADNTAAAILALVAAGSDPSSEAVRRGIEYLRKSVQPGGGVPYLFLPPNAASDCWVIQAFRAAGQDPSGGWGQGSPVSHLLSLQQSDGSFRWTGELANSPLLMTAYAIPSLLGKPYPVPPSRAEQVTVDLRIEGEKSSLLHTQLTLDQSPYTPLSAVREAARKAGIPCEIKPMLGVPYLNSLGGEAGGWQYRINSRLPMIGAQVYQLQSGDEVVWFYDYHGCKSPLRLVAGGTGGWSDETLRFRVEHYDDEKDGWYPARGVSVVVGERRYPAPGGEAAVSFAGPGRYRVYAEKEGAIRSEKKMVAIEERQTVRVKVRIEDGGRLFWEGSVSLCGLATRDVQGRDVVIRRPVLIGAVDAASKKAEFPYCVVQTAEGLILLSIQDMAEDNEKGSWWYRVNGENIFDDVDEYVLKDGDEVLLYRSRHPRGDARRSERPDPAAPAV